MKLWSNAFNIHPIFALVERMDIERELTLFDPPLVFEEKRSFKQVKQEPPLGMTCSHLSKIFQGSPCCYHA